MVGTFIRYRQRLQKSGGISQERLGGRKNSKGQDEEQGLDQMLEEDCDKLHGDVHIDEATLFNDIRESEDNWAINQEGIAEGLDDDNIPLLDKATEKKESKDKKINLKRIRDDNKPKGGKKKQKSDKERVNKSNKEKTEDRSSNKEHKITATTPTDMQELERKKEDKDRRKEKGTKRRSKGKGSSNS